MAVDPTLKINTANMANESSRALEKEQGLPTKPEVSCSGNGSLPFPELPPGWKSKLSKRWGKYCFWPDKALNSHFAHPISGKEYDANGPINSVGDAQATMPHTPTTPGIPAPAQAISAPAPAPPHNHQEATPTAAVVTPTSASSKKMPQANSDTGNRGEPTGAEAVPGGAVTGKHKDEQGEKSTAPSSRPPLPFPALPQDWHYQLARRTGKFYFWKRGADKSSFKHPTTGLEYRGGEHKRREELGPIIQQRATDDSQSTSAKPTTPTGTSRPGTRQFATACHQESHQAIASLKPATEMFIEGRITKNEYSAKCNVLNGVSSANTSAAYSAAAAPGGDQPPHQTAEFPQNQGSHQPQRRTRTNGSEPSSPFSPTAASAKFGMPLPDIAQFEGGLLCFDDPHPDPAPHLVEGVVATPPTPKPPLSHHTAPALRSGSIYSPPEGEEAVKYSYDFFSKRWTTTNIRVRLDGQPWNDGTMRLVFHMKDLTRPRGPQQDYVAKLSKDKKERDSAYFMDVEMQSLAGYFADEYNKLDPPKKVWFMEASVIECKERVGPNGRPAIFGIEPYVHGTYCKYTNNYGWIAPDNDRSTPQAFSHFTHYFSCGHLLVADIQGVGDRYTDPQVHSRSNKGFGKGNLGGDGIHQFFSTHKCNAICKALKMPSLTAKPAGTDGGTVVQRAPMKGGRRPGCGDADFRLPPPQPGLLEFALDDAMGDHISKRIIHWEQRAAWHQANDPVVKTIVHAR